jgi:hypothetical protein
MKTDQQSPNIHCSISIGNELDSVENYEDCECNKQIKKYSPDEILTIFCELVRIKICKIVYDHESKTLKMKFFGAQNPGENNFILELACFPLTLLNKKKLLKQILAKEIKKNFNFKLISDIKNSLQRIKILIEDTENYVFFKIKQNKNSKQKGIKINLHLELLKVLSWSANLNLSYKTNIED